MEKEPMAQKEQEGQIEGRNAVMEAIRAKWTLDKVYIAKGDTDRALKRLAAAARETGAVVVETDRRKLDTMSITRAHQGVIALTAAAPYQTIQTLLNV